MLKMPLQCWVSKCFHLTKSSINFNVTFDELFLLFLHLFLKILQGGGLNKCQRASVELDIFTSHSFGIYFSLPVVKKHATLSC